MAPDHARRIIALWRACTHFPVDMAGIRTPIRTGWPGGSGAAQEPLMLTYVFRLLDDAAFGMINKKRR